MARGWESKSVEAQQADQPDRSSTGLRPATQPQHMEDPARASERATLSLARIRALADLQLACAPAHRAMLEQAIAELDRRIAALVSAPPHEAR